MKDQICRWAPLTLAATARATDSRKRTAELSCRGLQPCCIAAGDSPVGREQTVSPKCTTSQRMCTAQYRSNVIVHLFDEWDRAQLCLSPFILIRSNTRCTLGDTSKGPISLASIRRLGARWSPIRLFDAPPPTDLLISTLYFTSFFCSLCVCVCVHLLLSEI